MSELLDDLKVLGMLFHFNLLTLVFSFDVLDKVPQCSNLLIEMFLEVEIIFLSKPELVVVVI